MNVKEVLAQNDFLDPLPSKAMNRWPGLPLQVHFFYAHKDISRFQLQKYICTIFSPHDHTAEAPQLREQSRVYSFRVSAKELMTKSQLQG